MNFRCAAVFAALLGCGFAASAADGVVNADLLNVRLAPELKAPVVVKLRAGDAVRVEKESGAFYEIAAPAKTPVYISGVYIRNGKTTQALKMYADMSAKSPLLGELPAGTEIKTVRETRYGWTQIEPPAGIRLYAAKMYIDLKNPLPAVGEQKSAEGEAAEKPVELPAASKPAEEGKPAGTPAATEEVKPAGTPAEAEVVKAEPKPAFSENYLKELAGLGVDPATGTEIETSGYVLALNSTTTELVRYAMLRQEGSRYITEYFLAADSIDLAGYVEKTVELKGVVCKVPEWKTPLLVVTSVAGK